MAIEINRSIKQNKESRNRPYLYENLLHNKDGIDWYVKNRLFNELFEN